MFVPEQPSRPRVTGRPPSPSRVCPVETRRCAQHGATEFAKYGRKWRCKRCVAEAVTRRHHKVRRILIDDAGGCCALCGYDRCIFTLTFHHVDPATKSFPMTMSSGKSLAAYRAEAAKCVLLCANCHGEVEAGLVESPPVGMRFASRASRTSARTGQLSLEHTDLSQVPAGPRTEHLTYRPVLTYRLESEVR